MLPSAAYARPVSAAPTSTTLRRRLWRRPECLEHLEPSLRRSVFKLRVRAIDGVGLGRPVELERDEPLRVRLFLLGHPEPPELPPLRRAREHSRALPPDSLVHPWKELTRFLGRDEPRAAAPLQRLRKCVPLARDLDLSAPRHEPVAEATVDRLLARPESGDRLAALVHVEELRVHHLSQHTAPAASR